MVVFVLNFGHSDFEFVWDFEFRASDFRLNDHSKRSL